MKEKAQTEAPLPSSKADVTHRACPGVRLQISLGDRPSSSGVSKAPPSSGHTPPPDRGLANHSIQARPALVKEEPSPPKRLRVHFSPTVCTIDPSERGEPTVVDSPRSRSPSVFEGLVAAEVWAGVGSLSHFVEAQGLQIGGYCECLATETKLLSHNYPAAASSLLYELGTWRDWPHAARQRGQRFVALFGGPVCASLSTGGKRQEAKDPRSAQFEQTVQMAAVLNVDFLLIENVPALVERDEQHQLFTRLVEVADKADFVLAQILRMRDSEFGGYTQRERVMVLFRQRAVHAVLPPPPPLTVPGYQGQRISELFEPVSDIPAQCWLRGSWEATVYDKQPGRAWLLGYLSVTPDTTQAARVGDECTLQGELGWWVIKAHLPNDQIEAFKDDRRAPTYRRVPARQVYQVRGRRVQVFSEESVAITLRSFTTPPDYWMAVWDTRRQGVRALTGVEVWRLMGLPPRDAQWLQHEGVPATYLGRMAGKSIPASMASTAAEALCAQVALWVEATRQREQWQVPVLHCDAVEQPSMVLIIVGFKGTSPRFKIPEGPWLFGWHLADAKAKQASLVSTAEQWAATILNHSSIICELAVDSRQRGQGVTSIMAIAQRDVDDSWLEINQLHPGQATVAREVAVKAASIITGWVHSSVDVLREGHFGTVPLRLVKPRPKWTTSPGTMEQAQWQALMINDDRAIKQLQGRLRQAATVTGLHALNEWSDTASVHDTAEIPPGVRSALMSFDPDLWRSATFPRRCQFPPLTKALPRPPPQPNRRRDVRGLQDFFLPDVWQEIQSWIVDAISNVDSDDPIRNTPLVLGPSACQPWVEAHQGTIWDCRKAHTDGFVTTLDFHADTNSHLNRGLIASEFADWPDQECVSFMLEGVQYKAEVGWQFILCHHMQSFRATADKVTAEFVDHSSKGWFEAFDFPPFVPMRLVRRGSVPRKNGGRPRPTMNSSWPHDDCLTDRDGFQVISINEASGSKLVLTEQELRNTRRSDATRHWADFGDDAPQPKEVKPTSGCLMAMLLALVSSAQFLDEPVFILTDDAANYFNQFALAPSEYWKFVTLLKNAKADTLGTATRLAEYPWSASFMAEYCMGFGTRPSSNVAQRFAYMIVDLVMRRFTAEEETLFQSTTDTKLQEWYRQRKSVASSFNEAMLFFMLMYTDDPIIAVVGVERTVRFLICWARTTTELNLHMALACKRQLGTAVVWCGMIAFARGAIVIPLDKRLKALAKLRQLQQGALPVGELLSLNGLLEFCRGVLRLGPEMMHGLYVPLRAGQEASRGPQQLVKSNSLIHKRIQKWIAHLQRGCANTVAAIIDGTNRIPSGVTLLVMSSDACKEGAAYPGMGGYLAGHWWRYIYEPQHLRLDIPVLELLAFGLSLVAFAPILTAEYMLAYDDVLLCLIDAQASPLVVSGGRASSPVMMFALDKIRSFTPYRVLERALAVAHVFGEGNKPADFASRSNVEALHRYATQCGLDAKEVASPATARDVLNEVLAFQEQL